MIGKPLRGGAGGVRLVLALSCFALGCGAAKTDSKSAPPCVPPDLSACTALDAPHAAVCRTERYDADSVEHRDVIAHECIRDKLEPMHLLLRDVEAEKDGDAATEARRRKAKERIDRLSTEATECGFVCTPKVASAR
ncbi:MAG: hypothetical protein IPJ34_11520 [Myxococcales bacterium]|nr:hypothetical protein [Myxococcales bacterium]